MDSSSFFAPVCKGFVMFHFCKKSGLKKKFALMREKYFFRLGRCMAVTKGSGTVLAYLQARKQFAKHDTIVHSRVEYARKEGLGSKARSLLV
jgi:hypothetical protein